MRKSIIVLLLLIAIPFQSTWAAMSSYCAHDDTHQGHFGHHNHGLQHDHSHYGMDTDHDNADDSIALDTDTSNQIGQDSVKYSTDSDLKSKKDNAKSGHHHHGSFHACCIALLTGVYEFPSLDPVTLLQNYLLSLNHDVPSARPERPQWLLFV